MTESNSSYSYPTRYRPAGLSSVNDVVILQPQSAPMQDLVSIKPNAFNSVEEFVRGTVLLLDKPYGWTSFDVLNKIKGFVRHHITIPANDQGHAQRFKIGHAGTLDPLATGLLVVCTGKYTKLIDQLQGGEKEYTGTIRFGQTTPSFDLETAPEGQFKTDHLTEAMLAEAARGLTGVQWQIPPSYSAKQIDGQRAYKAARKGVDVQIPAVKVEVRAFDLTEMTLPNVNFTIRCSKGTYIRTLAHDLGKRLDTGSHLIALRRTASMPHSIRDSISIDTLLARLESLLAK